MAVDVSYIDCINNLLLNIIKYVHLLSINMLFSIFFQRRNSHRTSAKTDHVWPEKKEISDFQNLKMLVCGVSQILLRSQEEKSSFEREIWCFQHAIFIGFKCIYTLTLDFKICDDNKTDLTQYL